jgi:hypothetical protein
MYDILGGLHTRRTGKALDRLHKNRKAERAQENTIDKCRKDLCAVPPIRVLGGGRALRQLVA